MTIDAEKTPEQKRAAAKWFDRAVAKDVWVNALKPEAIKSHADADAMLAAYIVAMAMG